MNVLRHLIYEMLKHSGSLLPDRTYIELLYRQKMGHPLNLTAPRRFNEKIQWLKLYDRRPVYHVMVDKAAVKDYAAAIIGNAHIIRTYGVWDRPEDIEWDSLPDSFILKLTAGGGGRSVCICHDKKDFDREKAIARLRADYGRNLYNIFREWAYKDVPQRVIAEELLESGPDGGAPDDYKFWCFKGKVRFILYCSGRWHATGAHYNYFDRRWRPLPFWRKVRGSTEKIRKPGNLGEMIKIAEKLAKGHPFMRVDLYNVEGRIMFGELTLYSGSGLTAFHPDEWDIRAGDMLTLPKITT